MLQQSLRRASSEGDRRVPCQAFQTDDCERILRFAAEALAAGQAAALVTLTEIRGGAAKPLGAQMAVREDGLYCGFVSGGCVEAAAACEALEAFLCGEDRQVRYGEGSPYLDITLPCGGGITLHIHLLRRADPVLTALQALEQRQPAGLRYCPQSRTLEAVMSPRTTGWHQGAFISRYRPCARVIIFGRSAEAEATAHIARAAGYDVLTSDGINPQQALARIDADTAVILLYHDVIRELPVLHAALKAQPFYIGALGSTRTHQQRVTELAASGWSSEDIARIKAPIGIFPQARDLHSLALSVLADVAAARHQYPA